MFCFHIVCLREKGLLKLKVPLKTTTVIPKTGSNKNTIHTKMYFSVHV